MDTGAAVTLIQKRLVPDDMINEEGTTKIRLTGTTVYLITVRGMIEVVVGLSPAGPQVIVEMIVR